MIIINLKSVLFYGFFTSLLAASPIDFASASGRSGKIQLGDQAKEDIHECHTHKKQSSASKKKEKARGNKIQKKPFSYLDQSSKLVGDVNNVNFSQIHELGDVVEFSPLSWVQLQPCLDNLIQKTLADPSCEKRTFRFDVNREEWDNHLAWQATLMQKNKYPIAFSFSNNGAEGDRIGGIYAIYHREVSITNYSKKEEDARESFVYRFFEGKLDKSLVNEKTFYNLMVRAGFAEEDFERGKYGYQDRIFVKPIKLKGVALSECTREVQGTIDKTLKKANEPFVAFIFELPVNANFKVQELHTNHLAKQSIPTIVEESEKRLYLCFLNDQRKALDLHGKSYNEAFESVINFIQEKYANHKKLCTIITGRGNHKNLNGTHGVIFSDFSKWMQDEKICSMVQRCIVKEGVYTVLLKKPLKCDLTKLSPAQNPYEIVSNALKKIVQTKDLRLCIKVNSEDFYGQLVNFLVVNEPELFQGISPLSVDFVAGELRLNLKQERDQCKPSNTTVSFY